MVTPSVAESLACGTPVITTHGTPWERVEELGCGWWVNDEVESLKLAMSSAMSSPIDRLEKMGNIGRRWMESDFSWCIISKKMIETYKWLIKPSNKRPSWVLLD